MISYSQYETMKLGEKLAKLLPSGSFVALKGDLASGKTTFTKGLGEGLGVKQIINSPTFNILKIYKGSIPLYHVDAYRLENNDYDLGISEYEKDGITVVEWPEYYSLYLPEEYLEVRFNFIDDNTRDIDFIAHGDKYDWIAKEMAC